MGYSETELKVRETLADKLNMEAGRISPEARLVDDLGMDSFASVEILFDLEEKFGIKIPDIDIEKAKTVKDIVDYVADIIAPKESHEPDTPL